MPATSRPAPHLFIDISGHGLGHLAQTAPVLEALARQRPDVRLTVRSGLPEYRLRQRIAVPFAHIAEASDFGFVMRDALSIDHAATAARYRTLHADWDDRVEREAAFLRARSPDFVLANVAYLPLAGAARAGIPAAAMCSLNWGDLFAHFYGDDAPWSARINLQISAAYAAATFLALEPAMPVRHHPAVVAMPPVAHRGVRRRDVLERLATAKDLRNRRFVLVAFGGIATRLPAERWPRSDRWVWLLPEDWQTALRHPACHAFESIDLSFSDLLASVDAVVTKPGYGTFVEAASTGTPVLYLRRDDWPEQDVLIDWLHRHARARELTPVALAGDRIEAEIEALWQQPAVAAPASGGAACVAAWLAARIRT